MPTQYDGTYMVVCEDWKKMCVPLRRYADSELQESVQLMTENERENLRFYNFALKQKDDLNKDLNFFEIELDDLIKQDDHEKFVQQYKHIRDSVKRMYNTNTMTYQLVGENKRPGPLKSVPIPPSMKTRNTPQVIQNSVGSKSSTSRTRIATHTGGNS